MWNARISSDRDFITKECDFLTKIFPMIKNFSKIMSLKSSNRFNINTCGSRDHPFILQDILSITVLQQSNYF